MPQFYLSSYIGSGAGRDPFRPALVDPGWSAIDLRPDPSVAAGRCLVALPAPAGSPPTGTINLGTGSALSAAVRNQLSNALGVTSSGGTVAAVVLELLTSLATKWKPLVPARIGNSYRQEIWLGGLLWSKEIPVIAGGATVSDSFTRSDSTTVGGSWVEDLADWSISSNQVTHSGAGDGELRYNSDLSGNDQYAQVVSSGSAFRSIGPMVRHPASSTRTYYYANVYDTNSRELWKRVAGTGTALISAVSGSLSFPGTVRVEAQGSTIRGLWNGTQYGSATDTAITSGPQTGIFCYSAQSTLKGDDFAAGDLPGPVPIIRRPHSGLIMRGRRSQ